MPHTLNQNFSVFSLLRFAWPTIGMMLVTALFTVTDGIFISRFAGEAALAASNIVYPALNLIFGFSIMLSTGGSALVAKTLGEGKNDLASRRFTMLVVFGFCLGAILAVSVILFHYPLLTFLGADGNLMTDARAYLLAIIAFAPFTMLSIIFDAFFIADGKPMQGLYVSLTSGLVNALGDYIFLAQCDFGILGAGLATGLSSSVAAFFGIYYFWRRSQTLFFRSFSWESRALLQTLGNGSSEMVTELSIGITTFLFNLMVSKFAGTAGIAAITVVFYSEMLLSSFFIGFSLGLAPIFSYRYGAKNFMGIISLMKRALAILAAISLLSFSLANLFAEPLVALFLPSESTAFLLASTGLHLFSFSFLLTGFNAFTSSFFTALSDGKTSALLAFSRDLVGISLFLLVLPFFLGMQGIWLAVPMADICSGILSFLCLRKLGRRFLQKRFLDV